MHLNLGSILQGSTDLRGDHVAVRLNERTLSYAELDRAARGFATGLRERGLSPGDKVALMVPNLPEFTIAYFGTLYAGATVVPLNVLLSGPEVRYHVVGRGSGVSSCESVEDRGAARDTFGRADDIHAGRSHPGEAVDL